MMKKLAKLPNIEKYVRRPNRIFPRCSTVRHEDLPELQKSIEKLALLQNIPFETALYNGLRGGVGEVLKSYEVLLRERKRVMKLQKNMQAVFGLITDEKCKEWIAYDIQGRCGINLFENL
jgi:hypothetical protein